MTFPQSVINVRHGRVNVRNSRFAKLSERSVRFARRSVVYSLTPCAISRRSRLFQWTTLGAVSEGNPVAIFSESMEFIARLGHHGGITAPKGSPP
jgi:hypothetical protein